MCQAKPTDINTGKEEINQTIAMDSCSTIISWLNFYQHKIPYATILMIISSIAIILNITLIASLIATRQVTQNTSNMLICILSLSDLISGAVSLPLMAHILLNMASDDLCIKTKVVMAFVGNGQFSIFLTVLLAMDRYFHMNPDIRNPPSKIKTIFKKKNICYLVVFAIIFYFSVFIMLVINTQLAVAITITFIGILAVYFLIIACLYTRGYLRIRKFTDNNPVYNESGGSTHTTPDYVRRLCKTVLVLILFVFVQNVPICVVHIAAFVLFPSRNATAIKENAVFPYVFEFAVLLSNAGCFINSLIILHFNYKAKDWILTKLGIHRGTNQT